MKHQIHHLIRSVAMAALVTGTATLHLAADTPAGASPRPAPASASAPTSAPTSAPAVAGGVVRAYPIRGTVGTADPAARTVALAGKKSVRVVRVDDNTQLTRDGNAITVADLQTGDYVKGLAFKNAGEETLVKASVGEKPPTPPRRPTAASRAATKTPADREAAQQ